MPFVTQGLKLTEDGKTGKNGLARYGIYAFTAFGLAVAVAVPSSLWVDFTYGGTEEYYAAYIQPKTPYNELERLKIDLSAKGKLEESETMSTFERIVNVRPKSEFSWSFIVGLFLVVGVYFARMRWPRWPLHPVCFLIWDTWASAVFCWTFLVAWFLRFLADKYGTPRSTRTLKVVMVGVVAGELMGGMFWMVVGWIYFRVTNNYPPDYNIFPY